MPHGRANDLSLDGRRCTQGTNGEGWAWGFLRLVLATIVGFDDAIEIVRAVQLSRSAEP